MGTFKAYHDASLTTEITSGNPLTFTQESDGSSGPHTKTIYIGSTTSGRKLQDATTPGTTQIVASIVDSTPASGHPATEIKLATTLLGLDSATGGASCNLGTQITSGVANALPLYVRCTDSTSAVGTTTELSLLLDDVVESFV